MAYVICEPCIGATNLACVDVCPVDCIQGGPNQEQMYIDPVTCIDCDACVPACPVGAIFAQENVPARWRIFIAKNTEFFRYKG